MGITFHGGMRAIAYEWGAPNHRSPNDFSPDHIAQFQLATVMQSLAGDYMGDKQHINSYTRKAGAQAAKKWYPIGTLNKIVYPVRGGMEDWAYAASWDKQSVCKPKSYAQLEKYPAQPTHIIVCRLAGTALQVSHP
jgi:hypothetical protein